VALPQFLVQATGYRTAGALAGTKTPEDARAINRCLLVNPDFIIFIHREQPGFILISKSLTVIFMRFFSTFCLKKRMKYTDN